MTNENSSDEHKNRTMHTVKLTDQEAYDAIEMLDHYADEMDVDRADELADTIEAAMDSEGTLQTPTTADDSDLQHVVCNELIEHVSPHFDTENEAEVWVSENHGALPVGWSIETVNSDLYHEAVVRGGPQ